jgi:hypothetical protein
MGRKPIPVSVDEVLHQRRKVYGEKAKKLAGQAVERFLGAVYESRDLKSIERVEGFIDMATAGNLLGLVQPDFYDTSLKAFGRGTKEPAGTQEPKSTRKGKGPSMRGRKVKCETKEDYWNLRGKGWTHDNIRDRSTAPRLKIGGWKQGYDFGMKRGKKKK